MLKLDYNNLSIVILAFETFTQLVDLVVGYLAEDRNRLLHLVARMYKLQQHLRIARFYQHLEDTLALLSLLNAHVEVQLGTEAWHVRLEDLPQ